MGDSSARRSYEKSRCTEEQMVKILREAGLCAKKHGVSDVTLYAWRKRLGQLEP